MARYCGQAIIDALVAAVVVELLIRAWREAAPGQRIRLPKNVVTVALANKMARTIWALLAHERDYDAAFVSAKVN